VLLVFNKLLSLLKMF